MIASDKYVYQPSLNNPIRDAEAIAKDLQNIYGFQCDVWKNLSKDQIVQNLKNYASQTFNQDEQLLIYITGHGNYVQGDQGYIIPPEGKEEYNDSNHVSWLSYADLLALLSDIKVQHVLLTVDACYSGSLEYAFENTYPPTKSSPIDFSFDAVKSFNKEMRLNSKIYITSAAADRKASDGINHSPFASKFMLALRSFGKAPTHILTVYDLFAYLQDINPLPIIRFFPGTGQERSFYFILK